MTDKPTREQVLFDLLFALENHPRKVFSDVYVNDKTIAFKYDGYTYRLQTRRRIDDPSYNELKARNRRVYYVKLAIREHDPEFFEQRKKLHQSRGKSSANATSMAYTDLHKLYKDLWDKLYQEIVMPPKRAVRRGSKDLRWKAVRQLQLNHPDEWLRTLRTMQARYPNQTKSWAHVPARHEFKSQYKEEYKELYRLILQQEQETLEQYEGVTVGGAESSEIKDQT